MSVSINPVEIFTKPRSFKIKRLRMAPRPPASLQFHKPPFSTPRPCSPRMASNLSAKPICPILPLVAKPRNRAPGKHPGRRATECAGSKYQPVHEYLVRPPIPQLGGVQLEPSETASALSQLNVANAPLAHLVFKQPETRETITDAEMTWILRNLKRLLSSHDFQAIEMGLIIARYSSQPLGRVIGSATSPGRLDQFIIDESGRWFERKTGAVGWKMMPRKFDQVFNRYLQYLNIDKRCLLPPSPIFPTDNSKGAIGLKGLRKILVRAREALGNLASASNSPAIRQASHKFRGLTVALVRAPELTVDNGEEGRK